MGGWMFWVIAGIIVALLAVLAGYIILIYNGFIALKNNIQKAWSNIDVLLKQRYDELPKLIKVCEGYMQHERTVLENVTKARAMLNSAGTPQEKQNASDFITNALRSLFAVVENYPQLKADTAFRQLQQRITEIENQIADRRELYNESVNLFNIRREQFPDLFIAGWMRLPAREMWQIDPEHRQDVQVQFGK